MANSPTWEDFYKDFAARSQLALLTSKNSPSNNAPIFFGNYGAPIPKGTGDKSQGKSSNGLTYSDLSTKDKAIRAATSSVTGLLGLLASVEDAANPKADIDKSASSRILDVISRSGYAVRSSINAGVDDKNDSVVKAFWEGLAGRNKTSTSEILKNVGWKPGGSLLNKVGFGAATFVGDVVTDPLTWVAPETLAAKGSKAVTSASKAARTADDFVRALESPKTLSTPTSTPITKSSSNIPFDPTLNTILDAADVKKLDSLSKGIGTSKYGDFIKDIPETGFFTSTTKKVPAHDKYVEAILNTADEPVYSSYEAIIRNRYGQDVKEFVPSPDAGPPMRMADIKKELSDVNTSPERKVFLNDVLKNHIKAVVGYAEGKPPGYEGTKGKDKFFQDIYGKTFDAKGTGPGYREIRVSKVFEPEAKAQFLKDYAEKFGMSAEDVALLSSSKTQKEFATNLKTVRSAPGETVKSVRELSAALKENRVGNSKKVKQLMSHFGVTTNSELIAVIDNKLNSLSNSEKELIKSITDGGPSPRPGSALPASQASDVASSVQPVAGSRTGEQPSKAPVQPESPWDAHRPATGASAIDNIVSRVKSGDKSPIAKTKAQFNSPTQSRLFEDALREAINAEVILPKTPLYQYLTKNGIKRTSDVIHKGRGRNEAAWNTLSQYTFFSSMIRRASKSMPEFKKTGGIPSEVQRAEALYNETMPVLKAMDNVLNENGVYAVLGVSEHGYKISLFDVLDSIRPDWAKRNIFTSKFVSGKPQSIVAPTQLLDAIEIAITAMKVKGLDIGDISHADELTDLLSTTLLTRKKTTHSNKPIPNGLASIYESIVKSGDELTREQFIETNISPIVRALPEIMQRMNANEASSILWHQNQVGEISERGLSILADLLDNPAALQGDAMARVGNPIKELAAPVGKTRGSSDVDVATAGAVIQTKLPEIGISPALQAESRMGKETADALASGNPKAVNAALNKRNDQATRTIDNLVEDIPDSELKQQMTVEGISWLKLQEGFFPHSTSGKVRPYMLDGKNLAQTIARQFNARFNLLNTKYSKSDLAAAFVDIQRSTPARNAHIGEIQGELSKAIGTMFSQDSKYGIHNRMGITPEMINRSFKHYGIHEKFEFPTDVDNWADAWKTWDTSDPLDLLSKIQAATQNAMSLNNFAVDMVKKFGTTEGPGTRILWSKDSLLKDFVPSGAKFDKEIAEHLVALDRQMVNLKAYQEGTSNITRYYDSATHFYKSLMTIYRAGHHIRNGIGNTWLNFMAGVDSTSHALAMKDMHLYRGRHDAEFMDNLFATDANFVPAKNDSVAVRPIVNGKRVDLTYGDIHRAAYDRGVFPDYHSLEDINDNSSSFLDAIGLKGRLQGTRRVGNKVKDIASTASELNDHFFRSAQFYDIVKKNAKKFKNLDDLYNYAAHETRKWHPDGSDLGALEFKYARRTILFYSWIRKAMPLVIESAVMRPGRALMYPKAMYAIAEAQGIDLESYGNPFPDDQLFPDWIRDSLQGPVTKIDNEYWGVTPGIPLLDIAKDYGTDPWTATKTVLDSTNPAIKAPIELVVGGYNGATSMDLRTGIPNYDISDFIDGYIPNSSYFTGITGKSLTQPWENKGGANRENKADPERTIANFFTGVGANNYSKYQKQAKREQTMAKNKAKER